MNTSASNELISDLLKKENSHIRDRIVVIGRRSSGKTVYLSLLYEQLWNKQDKIKIKALRGTDHTEYITAADNIRNSIWPPATQGITQSYLEVTFQGQNRLMVALDYPGEVFTNAFIKNIESDEVRTLLDHIDHAQAVILLVDPDHTIQGDIYSKIDNDYGLIQAINRIHNWPNGKDVPVVLVLTKADDNYKVLEKCGEVESFVRKYFSNLIATSENLKVCMVSALIETGKIKINKNHITSFTAPLLYCIEKIEINEKKQREERKKEEINKLCKDLDIKGQKKALLESFIWFLSLCACLALLIYFTILYLPSTVWHNLWVNTIGRF
ncbi:MAG: hypothetical protein NTW55_03590 [Planctomycetota bacterium]|nr:hypothetical protein [Planctomycetota bacterium]